MRERERERERERRVVCNIGIEFTDANDIVHPRFFWGSLLFLGGGGSFRFVLFFVFLFYLLLFKCGRVVFCR